MKNLISIFIVALIATSCGNMNDNNVATKVAPTPAPKKVETAKKDAMPWVGVSDLDALVKENPKKILVDVYTPWCGPCKMMDKMTFQDQRVVDAMTNNFYPVKFNAEGPEKVNFKGKEYSNPGYNPARAKTRNAKHQLSNFFAVRGYPTIVVMDENMEIIDRIVGYKQPDQLLQELKKHM